MMYQSRQLIVGDVATSYWDEGRGPVLFFVHGWLDSKDTFSKIITELKSDFRCIAVDMPNFGGSQVSDSIVNIDDFAHFLSNFLGKLKIDEYSIVAHSMGGQISIHSIAKGYIKPRSAVLIASSGIRNNRSLSKKIIKNISLALRLFVPKKLKDLFYKKIGSDYNTSLSSVHKKIIKNILREDILEEAKNIKIPVIFIYGDKDIHTPARFGRTLSSAVDNSELIIIQDADHWLHNEDFLEISETIRGLK